MLEPNSNIVTDMQSYNLPHVLSTLLVVTAKIYMYPISGAKYENNTDIIY